MGEQKLSEFGGDGRQQLTPDAEARREMFRDVDEGVPAPLNQEPFRQAGDGLAESV